MFQIFVILLFLLKLQWYIYGIKVISLSPRAGNSFFQKVHKKLFFKYYKSNKHFSKNNLHKNTAPFDHQFFLNLVLKDFFKILYENLMNLHFKSTAYFALSTFSPEDFLK